MGLQSRTVVVGLSVAAAITALVHEWVFEQPELPFPAAHLVHREAFPESAVDSERAHSIEKADARRRVLTLVGRDAVFCGAFRGHPYLRGRSLNQTQWLNVSRCASTARLFKRPWFFYVEGPPIDSWVATGLMASREGQVRVFWYDSAPCGAPGHCEEYFGVYRCPAPQGDVLFDLLDPCKDTHMPQPSIRR